MVHSLLSSPVAEGPLGGAGILVTRPARQAAGFAGKIAAQGGRPIIFPAIVILPPTDSVTLERAHEALSDYQLAIFVSANTVEYGAPDAQRWPKTLIPFAPGPGTAETLADIGIPNVRIPPDRFDSEGLLALPELVDVRGKRIVIFRGDGGRELLGETLSARGASVDYVECYRRAKPQANASGVEQAFAEGRIDAVAITSSAGLDNLWDIVGPATRATWCARPTFVPHPRIAEHARAKGLRTVETSGGDAGMLRGLLEWFATHSTPTH
jgi:uroporphyrinogen-III synthase